MILNLAFHDLTPPSFTLPPIVRRLLGLSLHFIPTPLTDTRILQRNWQRSLSDLERTLKLRFLFGDLTNDSGYIRSLYVRNTSYQPPNRLPSDIATWFRYARQCLLPIRKRRRYNLPRPLRHILQTLRYDDRFTITDSDKNLGPTLLLRTQYIDMCLSHLSLTTHAYRRIPSMDITVIRNKVSRFHRNLLSSHPELWKESKIITHRLDTSTFSRFRALPKLHKLNSAGKWNGSIRPIVLSVGSPTYGLSNWLDYHLRPYLTSTSSYIRDSTQLIKSYEAYRSHLRRHYIHLTPKASILLFRWVNV